MATKRPASSNGAGQLADLRAVLGRKTCEVVLAGRAWTFRAPSLNQLCDLEDLGLGTTAETAAATGSLRELKKIIGIVFVLGRTAEPATDNTDAWAALYPNVEVLGDALGLEDVPAITAMLSEVLPAPQDEEDSAAGAEAEFPNS